MLEILKTYSNGGVIEVYRQVDREASDYKNVFASCEYFAQQGKRTVITPRFSETIGNPDYHTIYATLKGTPCNVGRFYAKRHIYNRINVEKQNITEVFIRSENGLEVLYSKGEG